MNFKIVPYLLVNSIAFYLLPGMIKDTGSAIFVMLMGIPVICFVTSIVFGVKHSFKWFYPIIVALLFTPTLFIFYNATAWVYIMIYGGIALIGNLIGKVFSKPEKDKV